MEDCVTSRSDDHIFSESEVPFKKDQDTEVPFRTDPDMNLAPVLVHSDAVPSFLATENLRRNHDENEDTERVVRLQPEGGETDFGVSLVSSTISLDLVSSSLETNKNTNRTQTNSTTCHDIEIDDVKKDQLENDDVASNFMRFCSLSPRTLTEVAWRDGLEPSECVLSKSSDEKTFGKKEYLGLATTVEGLSDDVDLPSDDELFVATSDGKLFRGEVLHQMVTDGKEVWKDVTEMVTGGNETVVESRLIVTDSKEIVTNGKEMLTDCSKSTVEDGDRGGAGQANVEHENHSDEPVDDEYCSREPVHKLVHCKNEQMEENCDSVEPIRDDHSSFEKSQNMEPARDDYFNFDESQNVEPARDDRSSVDKSQNVEPARDDYCNFDESQNTEPALPARDDHSSVDKSQNMEPVRDDRSSIDKSQNMEPTGFDCSTIEPVDDLLAGGVGTESRISRSNADDEPSLFDHDATFDDGLSLLLDRTFDRTKSHSFSSNDGGSSCSGNSLNVSTTTRDEDVSGKTVTTHKKMNHNGTSGGVGGGARNRSVSESSAEKMTSSSSSMMGISVASAAGTSFTPHEISQKRNLSPPPLSSNINLSILELGKVAPTWLPDNEALRCMQCEAPFSFTRRRHHCRACGKIFCGTCSNLKVHLQYLELKESRVCSKCYLDLIRAQSYQRTHRKSRPNPNNPSEYCSVIPPPLQAQASIDVTPPFVMVPTGVLRKQGSVKGSAEAKQVMFSDGIRPGGDLREITAPRLQLTAYHKGGRKTKRIDKSGQIPAATGCIASDGRLITKQNLSEQEPKRTICLIPPFGLPPVVVSSGSQAAGEYSLLDSPTSEFILHHLQNPVDPKPVTFAISRFLVVIVAIVDLDCCLERKCWSFTTKGMRSVGQDELVILLDCEPDEMMIPVDVFRHFHLIYEQASQGVTVTELSHVVLPGSSSSFGVNHGGFLYIRRTFQCLRKLILPEPPYLFGILLQKWEMPWAKVFPLRLVFRLGAEFKYYPCPLMSVRGRRSVYGEIGHTIMNLLADFTNFQYMVPQIDGLTIHLEGRRTDIRIPSCRYDAVMRVLNGNNNDHILALGASFSILADSHLVCIQNEDGNYETQAINIENKTCRVTGASFVVFNGALKPTAGGVTAKSNVVEDGVMVQISPATMATLKQSWKEMKKFTINLNAGTSDDNNDDDEIVVVEWVDDDDRNVNAGVKSPIDGMSMQGIESIRIHDSTDYSSDGYVVHWTELFLIRNETTERQEEPANLSRLTDSSAQSACLALVAHVALLTENQMTKIGVRLSISSNTVSFKAGSRGRPLPDVCLCNLNDRLMPLLQKYSSDEQGTVVVELIIHVLHPNATIANTPLVAIPD